MRTLPVNTLALAALAVMLDVRPYAQQQRADRVADGGRVEQINVGGTPLIAPADAARPDR